MLEFTDEGIIISQKKYSENSLIVKVFSRQHGIYRGFVKSAKSTKNRTIFQVGNMVSFEFRARLEDNLGQFFSVDLVKSFCSKIIFDRLSLSCTNSLLSMIDERFLEREEHLELFEKLLNFLQKASSTHNNKNALVANYIKLELEILKTLGYGIDLSCCAVTNSTTNLAFVSPKSARAVSLEVGLPHQNKLLKLPQFLIDENADHPTEQILNGFNLSGFFLGKVFAEEDRFNSSKSQMQQRSKILEYL